MSSHRDYVLAGLLKELAHGLEEDADYWELAQKVWDTASVLTSYEDKQFREYLQWVEGNLDMLLNLEANQDTIGQFLKDQIALIKASQENPMTISDAEKRGALTYLHEK